MKDRDLEPALRPPVDPGQSPSGGPGGKIPVSSRVLLCFDNKIWFKTNVLFTLSVNHVIKL